MKAGKCRTGRKCKTFFKSYMKMYKEFYLLNKWSYRIFDEVLFGVLSGHSYFNIIQEFSRSIKETKIKLLIFCILFNLKEIWPKQVKVCKNWLSVIDKIKFQKWLRCVRWWTMNKSFMVFVIISCFISNKYLQIITNN